MQASNGNYSLMRMACALYFGAFVFCYIYFFQNDILYAAQHVLSNGQTHYNRTLGSVLITIVLFVVHFIMLSLTRFTRRLHVLTYAPSLMLLATLCSFGEPTDKYLSSPWPVIFFIVLLLALFVLKKSGIEDLKPLSSRPYHEFKTSVLNFLFLVLMSIGVAFVGNSDDVLHYRLRIERLLMAHEYRLALEVGKDAQATDTSLTMLRIYALSKTGQLPRGLSRYPLAGNAETILPDGHYARTIMLDEKEIFNHVGIPVKEKMPATKYLEFIRRTRKNKPAAESYELCAKELK